MSFKQVYITNTSSFLPNDPVSNDDMEYFLGIINDKPSKSKRIVLRNNGIKRRFYAITRDGKATHTNAEMTALAVRQLFDNDPLKLRELQMLSCGTSSPDQMMPSHAVMVHGWLPESPAMEVVSPSGVCCAGMHALKYAFMAIRSGEVENAVASGSERLSRLLRSEAFEDEVQRLHDLEVNPFISFEKEFLRWMLSDGAAAFLMSDKKNENGISLRLEWIEGVSYANEKDVCMYMASDKLPDGTLKSYMDYTPQEIAASSVLSIKQDVKLLGENIVRLGGIKLKEVLDKHHVKSSQIDHFLPHMSSEFFRMKIHEQLIENDNAIPQEKWFTNIDRIGNVGAGSIYLMMDELFKSGRLNKGEKILFLVPESSRFSYMYAYLTVC